MKTIIILAMLALLSGCQTHSIPPGECAFWEHSGNYGPFQTHVIAHNVVKQADGTFKAADYVGYATWLGFGPHDSIQGLVISGNPVPSPVPPAK